MEFYHFTEMPYPYVPEDYYERYGSIRVVLPNRLLDPVKVHDLYARYLEQYEYADEMGLHLQINEHHQTATCLDVSIGVSAASIIQRTRRGRILLIGYPIPHRYNPVQVAEEVAMLDCLSGGRINCGFVRGVGMELHPANTNPAHNRERFYEAFEVIIRCWTTGEPFSWEGKHYHFRYVNPFPQPYQRPHPPLWTSGGHNLEQIRWAAEKGLTYATLFAGFEGAAKVFEQYRRYCKELGLPEPPASRFAYACLCYVGETDEVAEREGRELMWYLSTREPHWFRFPPGWASVEQRKRIYRPTAGHEDHRAMSWESLCQAGLIICGGPDKVAQRIEDFYRITGAGNLLMMNHAGFMPNEKVLKSIKLFAEEVMPRVRHLGETSAVSGGVVA